jgi:hypothetical protein
MLSPFSFLENLKPYKVVLLKTANNTDFLWTIDIFSIKKHQQIAPADPVRNVFGTQ